MTAIGILCVVVGGLCMGSAVWPMKLMHKYQFEHWWFLYILVALVIVPWTITLTVFPHAFAAYADVPATKLILSNSFAACWGVANVLCGLCLVRIGVGLTQAILTGLGVSVATMLPMVYKGSGLFKDSPDLTSPAGLTVISGVCVMLFGVVLTSLAGFGRDRELKKLQRTSGSFLGGLIMTIIAGITSAGLSLAFVYCNGPIVSRMCIWQPGASAKITFTDEVKNHAKLTGEYELSDDGTLDLPNVGSVKVGGLSVRAASDKIAAIVGFPDQLEDEARVSIDTHNIFESFPVWAVGLLGGVVVNLAYPLYLMFKNDSFGVFRASGFEFSLSLVMGFQVSLAIALQGKGMLLLGALGASVGAGVQQAMQMVGGQGLGFLSGEWRGVTDKPRWQMYMAIETLIIASLIMALSKSL